MSHTSPEKLPAKLPVKLPVRLLGAAALTASLTAPAACSDPASSGGGGGKSAVSVVGFSVMKSANKQVIADFEKTSAGKGVQFTQTYGASGDRPARSSPA